jgi:hypothetical protein
VLAALLLNLGSGPPPAQVRGFGGGPFWRRYGYDRSYDAIRETSSTVYEPERHSVRPERPRSTTVPVGFSYREINARVAEEVAKDMQRLREKVAEEDELIIFLLLGE